MWYARYGRVLAVGVAITVLAVPAVVHAQQATSPNYSVNEVYFGPGGNLNSSSTNYQGQQTVEGAAGKASSANYNTQAGYNTSNEPLLEVTVNGGLFDLGVLSASSVKSAAASFSIRNYNGSGYNVLVSGTTLRQTSGATITAMSTQAVSTPGTQQFGINLRQNSSPSIGADPQQQPDSTFSYGAPTASYNTANQFKFADGDTIATSTKASGRTLYTMSFIANISNTTPAGLYGSSLSVIVVPTF